jgi:hypothetical protein
VVNPLPIAVGTGFRQSTGGSWRTHVARHDVASSAVVMQEYHIDSLQTVHDQQFFGEVLG